MHLPRRQFLAATAGAAAALSAAAVGAASSVSVRFNWTMKGEFTPFVVAREKGYYRDAGIDAQLEPGTSGTQAAQSVAVGHDQFGYIPSIQVIEGITKQQMPILSVAECGTFTGMCWASRAEVPLTGPRSLEGRKVSISPSSTFFQVWPAFAKKFGIDTSKVQVVGANPSARIGLFLAGSVDVMADIFYANDLVIIQHKVKDKLNVLRLSQLDFDPIGYLLVTMASLIRRDPKLVGAFTQATLRGFAYTRRHPGEAADIMSRADTQLAPDVIAGQVHNLESLINARPVLGRNEPSGWKRSLDILQGAGVIDRALDQNAYYTNQFV
jgi:NitT/TauT family transport system substrate-binding protein